MSVSPRQNFLKPPPVPAMPTVTLILPFLGFLELFGYRFGDRKYGTRSVDLDDLSFGESGCAPRKPTTNNANSAFFIICSFV